MSAPAQPQNTPQQPDTDAQLIDLGHVMTREHYERLAREAAGQK
jgi:hypothetical protein